jgi:hypothetical protein
MQTATPEKRAHAGRRAPAVDTPPWIDAEVAPLRRDGCGAPRARYPVDAGRRRRGAEMPLSRAAKIRIAVAVLVVIVAIGGWTALSISWRRGYAHGTVTGVVRKVSVHGPPYCKILTGELVYQGTSATQQPELFHFSVDNDAETNPVVHDLHEAERDGKRVTLDFRRDRRLWWRCNPSEYFITAVEK